MRGVEMLGRSKTDTMKERADAGAALAIDLARDKRFRKQVLSAVEHAAAARGRARSRLGTFAAVGRLAADEKLRAELTEAFRNLEGAKARVEKKRSHKLRNTFLIGIGVAVAALPQTRRWVGERIAALHGKSAPGAASVAESEASADADKPISRMTKDELVERARAEGVEVTDEMSRDEVYEALKARQG